MIKLEGIRKSFGPKEVLKGVSFQIEEGTIYGLIGRNGAGKTTLMNIMSGLMLADEGEFITDKKVGYLPDLPAFYDYLTTDEYLSFLLQNQNPKRVEELLELVSLPTKTRIKTMSRGMKQRLGIAAVLVNDPDIILLDEPTSALDPAGRNDVKDILTKLKAEGRTIILSTHILADMDSICDKAGFLTGGVIAKEVDMAEADKSSSAILVSFKESPDLDKLYTFTQKIIKLDDTNVKLVIDPENRVKEQTNILRGLAELNQEILSINSESISLDVIFREVCK